MANHVSKICLGTPVILKHIMEQLSNKDLIKFSLVNKEWNYEARSVLRDRRTLIANISSNQKCQTLLDFASDLENIRVVPFSGIRAQLSLEDLWPLSNTSLDSAYKIIFERLPCRIFTVDFATDKWETYKGTPALVLVTKILENYCKMLEELSFTFHWNQVQMPLQIIQQLSFQRLKILKLEGPGFHTCAESLETFVKSLVSSAPNLKELQMGQPINFNENVLQGTSAVLVPSYSFNPFFGRVCESLVGALRPGSIALKNRPRRELDEGLLHRHIPLVLQASRLSLHTLQMDLFILVPLMCYGICLENVTTLEILLDRDFRIENLQPSVLKCLSSFDFTRLFPKLQGVNIAATFEPSVTPGQVSAFIQERNALEFLEDRAINVKHLSFLTAMPGSTAPLLAQLFPDAKELLVETRGNLDETQLQSVWKDFNYFEELQVTIRKRLSWTIDVDSIFCGIYPEEVEELRGEDDEYLRAVNIVPVFPSIVCMSDLKSLTIRYAPGSYLPEQREPTSIFSRVTYLIGFARCPRLVVKFEAPSSKYVEALDHLRPYASFVTVDS